MVFNRHDGQNDVELSYALTPQGMRDTAGGKQNYHYYLTDQLGSVRVVFCDLDGNGRVDIHDATSEACLALGEVLQVNNFYPYGMQHVDWDISDDNPYMFQGKEMKEHTLSGALLAWYDFGARQYDPVLGRWHARDPQARKFASMSPYCGMGNNPVFNIDPDGEWFFSIVTSGIGWVVSSLFFVINSPIQGPKKAWNEAVEYKNDMDDFGKNLDMELGLREDDRNSSSGNSGYSQLQTNYSEENLPDLSDPFTFGQLETFFNDNFSYELSQMNDYDVNIAWDWDEEHTENAFGRTVPETPNTIHAQDVTIYLNPNKILDDSKSSEEQMQRLFVTIAHELAHAYQFTNGNSRSQNYLEEWKDIYYLEGLYNISEFYAYDFSAQFETWFGVDFEQGKKRDVFEYVLKTMGYEF